MAVYVMKCSKGVVKVGHSIEVENRRRALNNGEYGKISVVHTHECDPRENRRIEGIAHELLKYHAVKDEIFSCTPAQAILAVTRAAEIAANDPAVRKPLKDVKINIILKSDEYKLIEDMFYEKRYRSMSSMIRGLIFESVDRRGWKVEEPEWFTKNVIPRDDSVSPETTIDQ